MLRLRANLSRAKRKVSRDFIKNLDLAIFKADKGDATRASGNRFGLVIIWYVYDTRTCKIHYVHRYVYVAARFATSSPFQSRPAGFEAGRPALKPAAPYTE